MKYSDVAKEILKHKDVLIVSHNRCDGDTIGSGVALAYALDKFNINVTLCCSSDIPSKFMFLLTKFKYLKPEEVHGDFDLAVAVDVASEGMMNESLLVFSVVKDTIVIDHHLTNPKYGKTMNLIEDLSSNCELMYKVISEMCDIDKSIATALLTGMITDTGTFTHDNVNPETIRVLSEILKSGVIIHDINEKLFMHQSKNRAILYGRVMERMRFYLDGAVAIIYINQKDLEETGGIESDTDGFIDFPLSVDGVEVAISIYELKKNDYKVSFRSRGKVIVSEIASIYGGGGHQLASGTKMRGEFEEIIDKLIYNVKQRL